MTEVAENQEIYRHSESEHDSADDLEGYVSDDAAGGVKLPESQVKLNTDLFHSETQSQPNHEDPEAGK